MSRSRGSDAPHRPSPRAPLHLKATACSEANSAHHRVPTVDRSPKVSPRGVLQERKRGGRAAELETKLSNALEELKKLREQLALTEASKLEAERELAKAKKRTILETQEEKQRIHEGSPEEEKAEESVTSPATMDVFEVVVSSELNRVEDEVDSHQKKEELAVEREEEATKSTIEKTEVDEDNEAIEAEEEQVEEEKNLGVDILKAKLLEKEKQVAILLEENVIFKTRAEKETNQIAEAARAKEEDLITKLDSVEEELKQSRAREEQLRAQLEAAEGTKTSLETEMKRLRVQTEQWRKAAEEAAAVLATGDGAGGEMGGRRVAERCGSMDNHLGRSYVGWGSPLMAGDMDEDGGGRRKGTGIRMLGSLWKKNQHK